ncbi:MAG TPA: hypothetical protein VJ826_12160 [Candidatus Polarisedimenticolaceae bacterium]|nr:hypothetical protein [Candidatus Polarisedimenticolaceae bacterium]
MIELTEKTVTQFSFCDASLLGLVWIEEGRDLELRLELADERLARLTCLSVSDLNIRLAYEPHRTDLSFSWDSRFTRIGQRWHMSFEFPPEGRIELDCSGARIEHHR